MNFENNNQDFYYPSVKPTLIEPGVKYFLNQALKQAHFIREKFHNYIFNIGMFILFLIILGGILFYKYKGKISPIEKENKNREKQQYILEKIKNFQKSKLIAQQQLITGLPHWENEYLSRPIL